MAATSEGVGVRGPAVSARTIHPSETGAASMLSTLVSRRRTRSARPASSSCAWRVFCSALKAAKWAAPMRILPLAVMSSVVTARTSKVTV